MNDDDEETASPPFVSEVLMGGRIGLYDPERESKRIRSDEAAPSPEELGEMPKDRSSIAPFPDAEERFRKCLTLRPRTMPLLEEMAAL